MENIGLTLATRRSDVEQLQAHPELWPAALDELARHSPSLHSVSRIVTKRITIHGIALQPGERVEAVIASANRDERKFANPDELQFDRDPRDHLTFGRGIHYCIGVQLGKLESQIAIERLLRRMPLIARIEMLREPVWASTWTLRALKRLPLRGGD